MKAKFNTIDCLLILVLVAVVAVGVWFVAGRGETTQTVQDKTVSITVELSKQTEDFTKLPQVGDTVLVGEKERSRMTVTDVKVIPAIAQGTDVETGKYTETELPGYYDVHVTASAKGTETSSAVSVDNVALRVGTQTAIKSKNWVGYGFLIDVATVE